MIKTNRKDAVNIAREGPLFCVWFRVLEHLMNLEASIFTTGICSLVFLFRVQVLSHPNLIQLASTFLISSTANTTETPHRQLCECHLRYKDSPFQDPQHGHFVVGFQDHVPEPSLSAGLA